MRHDAVLVWANAAGVCGVLGYVWKSLTSSLDILMIKASVVKLRVHEIHLKWDLQPTFTKINVLIRN